MHELLRQAQVLKDIGKQVKGEELLNSLTKKLLIVPKKRKMIKACMVVLSIRKSRYFDAVCQVVALNDFGGANSLTKKLKLQWSPPSAPYESIDPYLR